MGIAAIFDAITWTDNIIMEEWTAHVLTLLFSLLIISGKKTFSFYFLYFFYSCILFLDNTILPRIQTIYISIAYFVENLIGISELISMMINDDYKDDEPSYDWYEICQYIMG